MGVAVDGTKKKHGSRFFLCPIFALQKNKTNRRIVLVGTDLEDKVCVGLLSKISIRTTRADRDYLFTNNSFSATQKILHQIRTSIFLCFLIELERFILE